MINVTKLVAKLIHPKKLAYGEKYFISDRKVYYRHSSSFMPIELKRKEDAQLVEEILFNWDMQNILS